jgi:hypothetical protein
MAFGNASTSQSRPHRCFRQAESTAHGWPSFREPERIAGNVIVGAGGEVHSTCGTHLGHNLPDPGSPAPRYCLDLVCLAGKPAAEPEASMAAEPCVAALAAHALCGAGEAAAAAAGGCSDCVVRSGLALGGCSKEGVRAWCAQPLTKAPDTPAGRSSLHSHREFRMRERGIDA